MFFFCKLKKKIVSFIQIRVKPSVFMSKAKSIINIRTYQKNLCWEKTAASEPTTFDCICFCAKLLLRKENSKIIT